MSELDSKASALLSAAAREERVSSARKAAVRRSLDAALAAGAGAGAGAATGKAVGASKLMLAKLSITVVAVAAAGVFGWKVSHRQNPIEAAPQNPPLVVEAAVPAMKPSTAEPGPRPPAPELETPEPAPPAHRRKQRPLRVETREPAPETPAPVAAPTSAARGCSLSDELGFLKPAQLALDANDPARAIALLTAHRTDCAHGTLTEEREAAWVLALCAAHRDGDAQQAAALFQHSSPRSPHLARLRASCAAEALKR